MSRPVVLSNGELHVGINQHGLVHDFYYPYVGVENHTTGSDLRHRVGVWADGSLSWLDDSDWTFKFSYHHEALIGRTRAKNEKLGILLEFDDAVDSSVSALMRNIHVVNLRDAARDVRLFMHQAFAIGDVRSNTDTAQYLPDNDAILHYRGRRAFVISGLADGKPFDQYTVGLFGIEGREGTYRDAEDGELSMCAVEHGRVDSTLRFRLQLAANSSGRVHYWIAAGTSLREALYVHKHISDLGVAERLRETSHWWRGWFEPARRASEKIDPAFRESFLQSAMILKSQIDKRGAIMASTDTTMLNYSRDAYAYCWPRDGAYVVWPLIRMGYTDEPRRFFEFCRRTLHANGYLMHKYQADGALGSSWHPYIHDDGIVGPPIQEDETAAVLFVFAQYYQQHEDMRVLRDFYEPMVKPMADFLADYIDEETGLPKPSYDLWEEVYLTTTYTTAITYAALLAAADLADTMSDADNAVKWRSAASDMAAAAKKQLFNPRRNAFYKGLIVKDGRIEYDETIDTSSVYGVFMFGLFALESEEMQAAVKTIEETFGVTKGAVGLPRYEHDDYSRVDPNSLGNWWIITTLWLGQYCAETGRLDDAKRILAWVRDHADTTGALPEQVSPRDDSPVSVSPLTWSHAEYLSTLLDTIDKKQP